MRADTLAATALVVTAACTSAPRRTADAPQLADERAVRYEALPWTEAPAQDARWIEVVSAPAGAEIYGIDEAAGVLARTPWRTQVGYSSEPELVIRMPGYRAVRVRATLADYHAVRRVIVTLTPAEAP